MEPDVEPPLLPLQGARVRHAAGTSNPRTTATKTDARQPVPRAPQRPSHKGGVSRLPASARSAPRVATQSRLPPVATKRTPDRDAPPPVPTKTPPTITRDFSHTRSKPLVPAIQRKNQEQKPALTRPRTNSEAERSDITPEGGSGGREGRRFAVANVGNNGRIYLR